MSRWTVELIEAAEAELEKLSDDMQAKFLHIAEMLEGFGPQGVGMPLVRPLRDKLWEMRLKGKDGIARGMYFLAAGRSIKVVRIFVKKTQKTPNKEIDLALKRLKEDRGNG